jgi:putative NIF3 family GTP cyclohydrolase 1 type 2
LQATLLKCAVQGISVFCPHTSLDAVHGGMNDWLAAGLIKDTPSSQVTILGTEKRDPETKKVEGGDGRLVTFGVPLTIGELIQRTKSHLGINYG